MPEKSGVVGQDDLLHQFERIFLVGIHQGHLLHLNAERQPWFGKMP